MRQNFPELRYRNLGVGDRDQAVIVAPMGVQDVDLAFESCRQIGAQKGDILGLGGGRGGDEGLGGVGDEFAEGTECAADFRPSTF